MYFIPSLSPSTWILLVAFWSLLLLYGLYPYRFFKKLGIPGPRPLPFIGTLLEYRKGVAQFDMECFKKFGNIWGLYDARQPVLAILDPAIIKAILVKECYTNFTNRRTFGVKGPMGSALTLAQNEQWKRIRTVLSPTFTSGRLKEMFHIMEDYANVLVRNIQVNVDKKEPCVMKDVIGAYSMDVITSTSFSVHIDSLNKPNDPFVINTKTLLKSGFFNPIFIILALFPFLPTILEWMKVNPYTSDVLTFFTNAVTSFRHKRQKGDHTGRVDFLQLMLDSRTEDVNILKSDQKALTDGEIMAQSVIFIIAGYETTSLSLSYLFYCLATHPDVQQRLQNEIDCYLPDKAAPTYDILSEMEYLDMVIQEVLRMYPPPGRIERVSKRNFEVNGVLIPKGTVVMIPTYVLHNNPETWPEPEEFRPERFSKENKANQNPFHFLPFGDGPRNCIGMRFALLSMKLATTVLLQNFNFRPCKDTLIPMEFSTEGFMQPKKPIVLEVISRKSNKE